MKNQFLTTFVGNEEIIINFSNVRLIMKDDKGLPIVEFTDGTRQALSMSWEDLKSILAC